MEGKGEDRDFQKEHQDGKVAREGGRHGRTAEKSMGRGESDEKGAEGTEKGK